MLDTSGTSFSGDCRFPWPQVSSAPLVTEIGSSGLRRRVVAGDKKNGKENTCGQKKIVDAKVGLQGPKRQSTNLCASDVRDQAALSAVQRRVSSFTFVSKSKFLLWDWERALMKMLVLHLCFVQPNPN